MKLNSLKLDITAIILTFLITRIVYKLVHFSYTFTQGVMIQNFLMDIGICLVVYNVILHILEKFYLLLFLECFPLYL